MISLCYRKLILNFKYIWGEIPFKNWKKQSLVIVLLDVILAFTHIENK